LWQEVDATVLRAEDGGRYYTNDETFIALARLAQEKKSTVKATVEMKGSDFWLTSLVVVGV
jgi:hypothetical protein